MSNFIHLHTHSHYSLLNALPKIPDLVKQAKKFNMTALALTDNANMYGAIEFYKACKKAEIKPIIGVDFYVANRTRNDRQSGLDNKRSRLVLLAKNEIGYKNLIKLVTLASVEGFYYKPRIDKELIEKYADGLICIMPQFSGETSNALKNTDTEKAKNITDWYKKIFTNDNFFFEITHHPEIDGQEKLMGQIVELAKQTGSNLVACQDVYYLVPEEKKARDTLMQVNTATDFSDRNSDSSSEDFSFISQEIANEYFKDFPEALENTSKIADMCNLELKLGSWVFPDFKVESGRTPDDELRHLAYAGLVTRKVEKTEVVETRIEYELKVIKDKGYAPYFLVVADLLRFAAENNIYTNIRGSVAGSMITYLTGITKVNPIEYKLPFERFLNPERPSAPDIDMDYADNRRDEVIEYAKRKYGADKVAQIGTFGTMMARGSVRDTARAMGFPLPLADKIAKLIPMGAQGFPMTIDRAFKEVAELKKMYDEEKDVKTIIDMARKIEGCARHISVHAAGVVISPTPLTDYTPLQLDPKGEGKIITQYDMHAVEDAGLLKYDFLGIKNLSILVDAVDRVEKIEGIKIDIETIPIDDKKTFEMLALGETIGLFQLNGSGMTKYLKELRPTTIHDINAMVALYRPGPIESIPQYIERKHNSALVKYLDPRMKTILDQSFGVITYQDDVMLIAIQLGGYSWLEADKLRKAMGKKIPAEMEAQKEKLLKGFVEHGLAEKKAETLWKLIEPFASYGFNKAHAASYGRVAYQTAYLKANFPAIYMSAVLTADSGDVEKIGEFITECNKMKIPVLPPDINESFGPFTVVKKEGGPDKIRFGLTTIKNFGEGISKIIIHDRKKNGKFKSLSEFLNRIIDRNMNKKSLEALIKTGALDEFGERGQMLANIEGLLKYNKEMSKADNSQDSLFGLSESGVKQDFKMDSAEPATMKQKLAWERELLGLYISGHPLDRYKDVFAKQKISIKKIKDPSEVEDSKLHGARETKTVKELVNSGQPVGGIIEEVRIISTKNNDQMAFLKIADLTGSIEAVVFPRTFTQYKEILVPDKCIAFVAKISDRNGEVSLIIERMKALE